MKRNRIFVAVVLLLVSAALAQDSKSITAELNQKWQKKTATLFIATSAADIRVNTDGTLITDVISACPTYANVIVDQIKVSDKELRINATRTALGTDARRYPNFPYDVQVRSALKPGWTDGDLIALVTRLFTPTRPQLPILKTGPDVHTSSEPGIERPKPVFTPDAQMTNEARRAKAGGSAWVDFVVNEDGTVSDVEPLTTDPYGFYQAAAAIVSTWRFKPATLNGAPVKVRLRSESNFCLY